MPQKIFDIIPVKKGTLKKEKKKKNINLRKYIFFPFFLFFLLTGVWAYFSFSGAEVEIWLKTEALTSEDSVTVNIETDYINVEKNIIPGKVFSEKKSGNQTFSSSGMKNAEEKARGVIRVYNNHGTEPQTLLPKTRLVSSDGKLFRTLKRETVPGGKYVGGKLEPGYIDIEVIAAEPGKEYNIEPSAFSIPGFAGTSKYTTFYGKSFSRMEGGFKGETSFITEEDIEEAEKSLKERILKEAYDSAKAKAGEEYVLLGEDAVLSEEIINEEKQFSSGDFAEEFEYGLEIRLRFLGFKKMDIEALALNSANKEVTEGKKLKEDSISIDYEFIGLEDDSKANIKTAYDFEVYPEVNLVEVHEMALGAKREEIREKLEKMPEIKKVRINSWPLFRKSAPEQKEKVEIKVNI